MAMKRVMISGGSGLIGKATRSYLEQSGVAVVNLVRSKTEKSHADIIWSPNRARHAIDDVTPLESCDWAVHLSGANLSDHRWTPSYKREILDSRVQSSRSLLEIFARLKMPPHVLVCASATGIYGDRGDEVLTEETPSGTGFLPEVCQQWEASTSAAAAQGIRVVHLRFGVVLSPLGGALKSLLPVFKLGLGGRLGNGHQWMSWITLDDVARAIHFALQNGAVTGACNCISPQPVTNRGFTAALGKALHRPAPWMVPAFALKAAMGQMAQDTLLSSTRALPIKLEAAGFEFKNPSLQPALEAMLGSQQALLRSS